MGEPRPPSLLFGHGAPGSSAHTPSPSAAHDRWLETVERAVREDYDRLHEQARKDPQRSGHGGELTWARFLRDWLPPHYEVATRKYVIPDEGDDVFETDLIVFRPSYPKALREREEVLAAGVAAAFSVKLTLDREGIKDGFGRAVRMRRGSRTKPATVRGELLGQFPVGLLAHSHAWKGPDSQPGMNVSRACIDMDHELVRHPCETLDFLCVADLGTWSTMRISRLPSTATVQIPGANPAQKNSGAVVTAISEVSPGSSPALSVLVSHLFARLALSDPELDSLADGLRFSQRGWTGQGEMRLWDPDVVYTEDVRRQLGSREGLDWRPVY